MKVEEIRDQVNGIKWWHTIDLGNGIVTPGLQNSPEKLRKIGLPEDLTGKSVLDIGAWDGFFSFATKKRGAERVLATDSFSWNGQGWGNKKGFELARKVLGLPVEDLEIDALDLTPDKIGTFDLVLFLGVLYHMRYPLLALEKAFSVTAHQLILETQVDMLGCKHPALAFYPTSEMGKDDTNWFGPNPAAVIAMLKSAGFKKVITITPQRSGLYRFCRLVKNRIKQGTFFNAPTPLFEDIRYDRMVFHAWK